MCDANDQEELKKYTRRDFAAWAASAGMLTTLPSVANAVAVAEREVTIATPDGHCDAYFVTPSSGPHLACWCGRTYSAFAPPSDRWAGRPAESGYSVLVVNPFYQAEEGADRGAGRPDPHRRGDAAHAGADAGHASERRKGLRGWLDAQSEVDKARKIGTTGYCMGGPIAVRTARWRRVASALSVASMAPPW